MIKCKKKAYKDKDVAIAALHTINNDPRNEGNNLKRVYECELCHQWHLTSKRLEEDITKEPYQLKYDWSKLLAA